MLKQLFKKVQKIPISIEIVHFLFLLLLFNQFTRFLFFKNFFRKLIKFSLIFCIQNKKKFSSWKMLVPESKFAWKGKKNRKFWKKLEFFLLSTYNSEHIKTSNKFLKIRFFDGAE